MWFWILLSVVLNPHLPSGLSHPYQLDESISNFRCVWCTFSFLFYLRKIFLLANSEDPDQTPHSVASDLGLHCLCPKNGTLGLYGLISPMLTVSQQYPCVLKAK